MKPCLITKIIQSSITASLILALSSCSSSRESHKLTSTTRHPALSLQSVRVSPSRMISDAELQNSKNLRVKNRSLSVARTLDAALITTGAVVIMSFLVAGGIYAGVGPPEMHWPTNMPEIFVAPSLRSRAISPSPDCRIKLSGTEIRYVPSKNRRDVQIARVRGNARIDVIDRFGSYYCRADEIHYRAATNEIILNGRASVSAAYAPGIRDYGLARVDLARGVLEYSSNEKTTTQHSNSQHEELAMIQTKMLIP